MFQCPTLMFSHEPGSNVSARDSGVMRAQDGADYLIYWRDYRHNLEEGRVHAWYSNSSLLSRLRPGDRLWMVTSGTNVGSKDKNAGFLVGIWSVKKLVENTGDDPAYPRADYCFL